MNYLLSLYQASSSFDNPAARTSHFYFDAAREQYANAVRFGVLSQSMLGWARFERGLCLLETAALGPWARSK
jgi:hypothetical protein